MEGQNVMKFSITQRKVSFAFRLGVSLWIQTRKRQLCIQLGDQYLPKGSLRCRETVFQYSHEENELQKTQNFHHNCSTMENDINLKEEILRNMSVECIPGNALLDLLNREQKRLYSKTKTVLASSQHTGLCLLRSKGH
eukprot:XP_017448546.1 PREDICTED: killer cell lectin-like receptor 7 [Rattus norvegicus]